MTSKRRSSRASGKSATAARAGRPAPRRSRPTSTRSPASKPPSKGTSTPDYRFVGGKGGVGKTTCAAAIAVTAAAAGRRVLVISTDPAASLADAFQLSSTRTAVPDRPRHVRTSRGTLHIVEIDAARALERWLSARRETLERIALRGTWLDEDDVSRLLRLSLPGIDEIAALLEVARAGRGGEYDLVVVDTAPTGHTLRMLAMPETLQGLARVFDHMQDKHRVMVAALRGAWSADAEDALIGELAREGSELAALLRDPSRVRLDWVTLPEPMAVEETADAVARLGGSGLPLPDVIVNRITPPPPARCRHCEVRRAFESTAIVALRERLPAVTIRTVEDREHEPRTMRDFAAIGMELTGRPAVSRPRRAAPVSWTAGLTGTPADVAAVTTASASLVLFGGKGGTGKTTCAAAAAIAAAVAAPGRRVLLLSVDPAHSLADVLGAAASDEARPIAGAPANLLVRELDAARRFAAVRERYATAIDSMFDRLLRGAGGVDVSSDRVVMQDLIDLAPPGIDELVAITEVLDALDPAAPEGFGLVVIDTAPTGHALRLLETPGLVHEWVRTLMSIVLKYQPVVGIGGLGETLLTLSQGLGRLRERLTDPARTRFIAVTRAAALPRAETVRLVARLRSMRIHVPAVIVNAVGRGTCGRCRAASVAEGEEFAALRRGGATRRGMLLVVAPRQLPPPHGPAGLRAWAADWRLAGAAISSGSR